MYPLVSLFTHGLDGHERREDIVQHMHSRRSCLGSCLGSCLAFLGEVVGPVKHSDHGLPLVDSDQPDPTIWYNVNAEGLNGASGSVPWDNPSLSNPSPTNTTRPSKGEAPVIRSGLGPDPRKVRGGTAYPRSFPAAGRNSFRVTIFPRKMSLSDFQ